MVCVKQMDMKYDLVKGLMERDIGVKLQLYYLYYTHLKHREETKIHYIRESVSWFLFVCFFIKRPWMLEDNNLDKIFFMGYSLNH